MEKLPHINLPKEVFNHTYYDIRHNYIVKELNSKYKCLLLFHEFWNIPTPSSKQIDLTERPEFIKNLAQKFIHEYLSGVNLGIHYRFDPADVVPIKKFELNHGGFNKAMTEQIKFDKIAKYLKKYYFREGPTIYLAHAFDKFRENDLLMNMIYLLIKEGFHIVDKYTVDKFLRQQRLCKLFDTNYYSTIMNLLEQEILAHANHFVPWPRSTWSARVVDTRLKLGKTPIYEPYNFFDFVYLNSTNELDPKLGYQQKITIPGKTKVWDYDERQKFYQKYANELESSGLMGYF